MPKTGRRYALRIPFDQAVRLSGGDEQALVAGERHQTITHWRNLGVPAHAILRTLLRGHRTAARLKRATAGLRPVNGDGAPQPRERRAPARLQEQIVRLRKERGISQRQLSERVGIEQPRIARIEAGAVQDLELRTVSRLAGALGARVKIVLEKKKETTRPAAYSARAGRA